MLDAYFNSLKSRKLLHNLTHYCLLSPYTVDICPGEQLYLHCEEVSAAQEVCGQESRGQEVALGQGQSSHAALESQGQRGAHLVAFPPNHRGKSYLQRDEDLLAEQDEG